MFGLGTTEILIVLVIALLVFGPAKLPEIGRQIGGLMREMRRMSDDVRRTLDVDDYHYNRNDYRYDNSDRSEPEAIASANDYKDYEEAPPSDDHASEGDAPGTDGTVSRGATVYDGARPWSIQDDTAEPDVMDYDNGSDAAYEPVAETTADADREPATMAEPPGPPSNQKEL